LVANLERFPLTGSLFVSLEEDKLKVEGGGGNLMWLGNDIGES
jgi:hypothetical protein